MFESVYMLSLTDLSWELIMRYVCIVYHYLFTHIMHHLFIYHYLFTNIYIIRHLFINHLFIYHYAFDWFIICLSSIYNFYLLLEYLTCLFIQSFQSYIYTMLGQGFREMGTDGLSHWNMGALASLLESISSYCISDLKFVGVWASTTKEPGTVILDFNELKVPIW